MRSLLLRLRTLVLWLLALGVVAALAIVVLLQPAVLERVAPWAARQAGVELVVQGSGRAADGAFAIEQLRAQGGQWRLEIDRLSIRGLATHALLFDSRLEVAALSVGRVLLVLPPGSGEPATLPATLAVPLHYALPSIKIDELSVWRPDELLAAQGIAGGIDFDGSRHHVTLQAARLADTSLHGEASIAAQAPFALSVTLSAQRGPTEGSPIEANASLDGTLEHIGVTLNATGYAASLVGSAQVQPFAQPIIDRVNVRARGVDPNQVRSDLPHARIDGEVTGALAPDGRFNGEFSVRNQLPGPLDQARVPLHSLSARLQAGVSDARIDAIAADLGHGASLRGGARWGSEGSAFDVTVSAIDLSRLWSSARASSLAGAVQVQQSGAQVQARGQLANCDRRACNGAARMPRPMAVWAWPESGPLPPCCIWRASIRLPSDVFRLPNSMASSPSAVRWNRACSMRVCSWTTANFEGCRSPPRANCTGRAINCTSHICNWPLGRCMPMRTGLLVTRTAGC